MQGKIVNGFELKRLLGVGGMAEVWYAENEIHMPVAVKILNPIMSQSSAIVERFRQEAEIMVKLRHPNIRQIYGYGSIEGRPAIIMEYLEGKELGASLKNCERFTNEELVKWWNQLVDALKYTHEEGIIHRDIKPANIFVDSRGNIKLLDFGIAKIRESISMTHTGTFMGTLMYMSPEQIKDSKHIDYHTDIYSLAVTFVHLLTGKCPYDSTTTSDYDIQVSIVTKPLDLSEVPTQWRAFLEPYLAKEADQRPELRLFNAAAPVETPRPKTTEPKTEPVKPVERPAERPAETPAVAGKTAINERPYNFEEIKKENEHKKTFLGYDWTAWKKKLWVWLGIFIAYIVSVWIYWEEDMFNHVLDYGIIYFVAYFIQAAAYLALCVWIIQTLNIRIRKCDVVLSYIISGICLTMAVLTVCYVYVGGFSLFLVAVFALAALFVFRFEKFKALPYIVLVVMLGWLYVMSEGLDSFEDGIWLHNHLFYFKHIRYNHFFGNIDKRYYWDIISPEIDIALFAAIPSITLLVVAIIRSVKHKKAVGSEEKSDRIEPEKPVETTKEAPKNANNQKKGRFWLWIGGIVVVAVTAIVTVFLFLPSNEGALPGKFSVSPDKQVQFSKGNLQYQASTNTWRFAENQWDYVGTQTPDNHGNVGGTVSGSDNRNISSTYSGWIDLFGWGTSGWDSGNTYYQPWSSADYDESNWGQLYGPPGLYNLTGSYANADWGVYNPISNGGNTANQWRTLTDLEWEYVFITRATTSGIRYAKANVNNVNGVILLPDDWSSSTYSLSNANNDEADFSSNTLTGSQWSTLEQVGAVFLPAAGYRYGTSVSNGGYYGDYWSASYGNSSRAYGVHFHDLGLYTYSDNYRDYGLSVRLVRVAE